MKNILGLKTILLWVMILGFMPLASKAQLDKDPATWAYAMKKVSGSTYDVFVRCSLISPWHIYAQKQGKEFIGSATKFVFEKNAGVRLIGGVLEKGKKLTYSVKEVGITNFEYEGTVMFVQRMVVSPSVKVVKGSVTYQTCTHERCLSEKTVSFSIPVPGG